MKQEVHTEARFAYTGAGLGFSLGMSISITWGSNAPIQII